MLKKICTKITFGKIAWDVVDSDLTFKTHVKKKCAMAMMNLQTLITLVNRKPIHGDQYLHWDSNHFIAAKHSVYSTLAHRAKVVPATNLPYSRNWTT